MARLGLLNSVQVPLSGDINVLDFGTSAAAINAALQTAGDQGDGLGGRVILPNLGREWTIDETVIVPSWVELVGYGRPRLVLADGMDAPILMSEGYLTTTPQQGIRLRGLYIDCNKANQASGDGVLINCRDLLLDDIYITGVKERGLVTDYTGATSPHGGRIAHLTIDSCGKTGWFNALSDLHADDINVREAGIDFVSTYDGIELDPSTSAVRMSNVNVWSSQVANFMRYALNLASGGSNVTNVHLEAGGVANLFIGGDHNDVVSALIYNAHSDQNVIIEGDFNTLVGSIYPGFFSSTKGVQLGVLAAGAAAGNTIDIRTNGMEGGSVNSINSGGGNDIRVRANQSSTAVTVSGTRVSTDKIDVWVNGTLAGSQKAATRNAAVAAAGNSSGTATLLTASSGTLTSTVDTEGVRLNVDWTVVGHFGTYINGGSFAVLVYPHTGGNWQGLGANVAITLAANATLYYARAATGGWGYIMT